MKKRMRLLLILVLAVSPIVANLNDWHWQEVEYHYDSTAPNGELTVLKNYWMGDTIHCLGETYTKLYSKVVYQDSTDMHPFGIVRTDSFSQFSLREDTFGHVFIYRGYNTPEWMLYDFSDWNLGDTLFFRDTVYFKGAYTVISENNLDSIQLIDGSYAQTVDFWYGLKLIKGIGFQRGFLLPESPYSGSYMNGMIVAFYKGNQLIWKNSEYVGLKRTKLSSKVKVFSSNHCLMLEVPVESRRVEIRSLSGALLQSFSVNDTRVVASKALPPGVYLYAVFGENGMMIAGDKVLIP